MDADGILNGHRIAESEKIGGSPTIPISKRHLAPSS
jgi:hypothetical protein